MAFVIVGKCFQNDQTILCSHYLGLSVVTMCVDLASTHLKAYFTRIHYFGRAKRFLGMHEELKEIVALLGAIRKRKHGKVKTHSLLHGGHFTRNL